VMRRLAYFRLFYEQKKFRWLWTLPLKFAVIDDCCSAKQFAMCFRVIANRADGHILRQVTNVTQNTQKQKKLKQKPTKKQTCKRHKKD